MVTRGFIKYSWYFYYCDNFERCRTILNIISQHIFLSQSPTAYTTHWRLWRLCGIALYKSTFYLLTYLLTT